MKFAVIYRRGAGWVDGVPFQDQPGVYDHRDFLAEQYANGSLVFAGPFLDDTGELALFEAETLDDVLTALERDASVRRHLMEYDVHPIAPQFERR